MKQYRSRSGTVDAVCGVGLRVAAGGMFGFLGPNGAGKSTTVRMLTTLLSITGSRAGPGQPAHGLGGGTPDQRPRDDGVPHRPS